MFTIIEVTMNALDLLGSECPGEICRSVLTVERDRTSQHTFESTRI